MWEAQGVCPITGYLTSLSPLTHSCAEFICCDWAGKCRFTCLPARADKGVCTTSNAAPQSIAWCGRVMALGDFCFLQYLCASARCVIKAATWYGQERWQGGHRSTSSVLQPTSPVVFVCLPFYALLPLCVLYSLLVLSFGPWFREASLRE